MKKVLLIGLMLFFTSVNAADGRKEKDFGIYFAGYDPMPSSVGFHLGGNIFSFLRLSGGIGTYNDGKQNFLEDLGETLTASVLYLATLGIFDYDDVKDFVDIDDEGVTNKYIFSYSAGLTAFIPGWNFSPVVGVQIGRYSSKNHPFGLQNKQSFVTYRVGLDWQSNAGFMLGVGYAYTPALLKELENKFYGQVGWFF